MTPPEMVAAYQVVFDTLQPFKTIDGDLIIGPVRAANLVVSALAKAELLAVADEIEGEARDSR